MAHALIIATAKADKVPIYESYLRGNKIKTILRNLNVTTSIDLSGGGGYLNSLDSKNIFDTIR